MAEGVRAENDEIGSMPVGPDMDRAIAIQLFHADPLLCFSTDDGHALFAIDALLAMETPSCNFAMRSHRWQNQKTWWGAGLDLGGDSGRIEDWGYTRAEAICRLILRYLAVYDGKAMPRRTWRDGQASGG